MAEHYVSGYLNRIAASGRGKAIAVKDLIDVTGTLTTAACRAVERRARVAPVDAACVAGIRDAQIAGTAWLAGKTTLHELAFGADGINHVYGTPTNPLDAGRAPGGSSSGSATVLSEGTADIALGSDTGGSIRIPAACCGVFGLKTTWDRVSTTGVWPLAPTLDTIGPMARTLHDLVDGMALLEPGFRDRLAMTEVRGVIGRIRNVAATDPAMEYAVDEALAAAGYTVIDIETPMWDDAHRAGLVVLLGEAWRSDGALLETDPDGVSPSTTERLLLGRDVTTAQLTSAREVRDTLRERLAPIFEQCDALAMPTIPCLPPLLDDASTSSLTSLTRYANIGGLPALAVPIEVPRAHRNADTAHLPASLQLIGPPGGDEALLRLAERVPAVVRSV